MAKDPVEFLIGRSPQFRVARLGIAHQPITGQCLLFTFNFNMELKPVGQHGVERHHAINTIRIFGVDQLLGLFVQGIRLGPPQVFQIVMIIRKTGGAGQEGGGLIIIKRLPPEIEKERAILNLGRHLLNAIAIGERSRRLGVGREPETTIGA